MASMTAIITTTISIAISKPLHGFGWGAGHEVGVGHGVGVGQSVGSGHGVGCLLYTSDAADE
ncbi:MAG: hypothetical protein N2171_02760, partial [Clostridia bacterium]|nr:hypothetical protein [Clostridia bacterium]